MSGPAGRFPGKWVTRRMRGGDLLRAVAVLPGRAKGACREPGCEWPGPSGVTPHNIGRALFRHTRATGHVTRMAVTEVTEYRLARRPS